MRSTVKVYIFFIFSVVFLQVDFCSHHCVHYNWMCGDMCYNCQSYQPKEEIHEHLTPRCIIVEQYDC